MADNLQRLVFPCPNPDPKTGTHDVVVHAWGDRENPRVLVCAHALTRNARDFDFLARHLASEYRIYCPDITGRGESAWLDDPEGYTYPTYVADMLLILGALGAPQIHWLGTSMGGLIGMLLAAHVPGLVHRLVINDIGPFIPKEALMRIGEYVGQHPHFSTRGEAEAHLREIMGTWGITEEAHWQHVFQHSIRPAPEGAGFQLACDPSIAHAFRNPDGSAKALEDIAMWEVWQDITCPVLLLRGAESDLLREETASEMEQRHPALTRITYPGIGHAPALMAPDHITAVGDWLLER